MEIRQLRYFLSAIRRGSLTRAATEHFVTQPAISLQLKKLEGDLGERLYLRRNRRIVPTDAGRVLAEHASEIIQRVDALEAVMQGLKGLEFGSLRIGTIDAASIYLLPGIFRKFQRRYPGVDIEVLVADSDRLVAALSAGAIELAIVTLPLAGENLDVKPIYEERMLLVAHPRHELAIRRCRPRVALREAADGGLITYPARSTTRRLIEKVFIENGLSLRVSMEMSSPEAIKRLTEAGLGASILPEKVVAAEIKRGQLVVISTGRVRFARVLGLVRRAGGEMSPPPAAFVEMLVEKYKFRNRKKDA